MLILKKKLTRKETNSLHKTNQVFHQFNLDPLVTF
jgi:hypothetical protein